MVVAFVWSPEARVLLPEQGVHRLVDGDVDGGGDQDDQESARRRRQPCQRSFQHPHVHQVPSQGVQADDGEIHQNCVDGEPLVLFDSGDQGIPPCADSRACASGMCLRLLQDNRYFKISQVLVLLR